MTSVVGSVTSSPRESRDDDRAYPLDCQDVIGKWSSRLRLVIGLRSFTAWRRGPYWEPARGGVNACINNNGEIAMRASAWFFGGLVVGAVLVADERCARSRAARPKSHRHRHEELRRGARVLPRHARRQ